MKKIFEPVRLNHLSLRNRLVRSATWEGIANQDGSVTEEAYAIYEELAKGGVGAIITGFTSVASNDFYFGDRMLSFPFMGWVECIANTAYDWQFSGLLNNVHTEKNGDFSQAEKITHTGALLVGTYDNFTDGDPSEFLRNLNSHMPTASQNDLIFIEKTGHTYQMKQQEVADKILNQLQKWRQ